MTSLSMIAMYTFAERFTAQDSHIATVAGIKNSLSYAFLSIQQQCTVCKKESLHSGEEPSRVEESLATPFHRRPKTTREAFLEGEGSLLQVPAVDRKSRWKLLERFARKVVLTHVLHGRVVHHVEVA